MEFYEVIKKRRSYRSFNEARMPEKETIKKIINAGRLAPTWANMQGVEYIIVQKNPIVKQIWKAIGQRKKFSNAPMFIVGIIAEKDSGKNKNGEPYYPVDFGICFEHIILAATAEGLATCWIGYFDEEKVKEILHIPKKKRVLGLTPLGYPLKLKDDDSPRKDLESVIHWETF
ncbi:MAG: 5,6-dimethylbenzimidazole synthase [Promethearchaeota archaeon]|nr:MAG: 5,6-dimethylbenzimidazole synthase [Candidatus Lokiarchaeota archaeon]